MDLTWAAVNYILKEIYTRVRRAVFFLRKTRWALWGFYSYAETWHNLLWLYMHSGLVMYYKTYVGKWPLENVDSLNFGKISDFSNSCIFFYKKDLDEISKGENEYLGEMPKFSAAPQKKREGKGGILYFFAVHASTGGQNAPKWALS